MKQTLKELARGVLDNNIDISELRALFGNHVLIQLADASILNNSSIKNYIDSNHYIVFIENTRQIYVDGIYYGTSVDRETVEELIQQYFDENVQELVDAAITTLVEKDDDHIEVKLVETWTENLDTHTYSYTTPYKYDITLKDIASNVDYQGTKHKLADLVAYTYTTTEIINEIPTQVTHDGEISSLVEYLKDNVIGQTTPDPNYNTLDKIAAWIANYEAGDIDLGDLREKVEIHDTFLDVRDYIVDDHTQEERPITLSELVEREKYSINGPLKDPEFVVNQEYTPEGDPILSPDELNIEGIVPYKTLTELNVALKKVSDRIAEGEEPAEANKINTIIGDDIWIDAVTNTSSKETAISFKEEQLTYTLNKRLCWNEVIRLPEPDNG